MKKILILCSAVTLLVAGMADKAMAQPGPATSANVIVSDATGTTVFRNQVQARDESTVFVSGAPTNNANGAYKFYRYIDGGSAINSATFYTNSSGFILMIDLEGDYNGDDALNIYTNGAVVPPPDVSMSLYNGHDPIWGADGTNTGPSNNRLAFWVHTTDAKSVTNMFCHPATNSLIALPYSVNGDIFMRYAGIYTVGRVTAGGFKTLTSVATAPTAITFPSTGAAWTNTQPYNIILYINNNGVTGTSITKNGQQIFSAIVNDVSLALKPGDYFSETYSVGTPGARYEPN